MNDVATTSSKVVTRLPEELVSSALFLLKRLGMSAKERSFAAYEELGLHPYHYAILAVLDEGTHAKLVAEGQRRLSWRATKAALFIHLYRDQPILHLPFQFLTTLVEVDELLATWRYRHALMVHRMVGTKIGTGGSSGHRYRGQSASNP
jgi:hypothetical protein